MGNCWPAPVHDPTYVSPKPPSPDHSEDVLKKRPSERDGKFTMDDREVPPLGEIITPNLKVFTYAELKRATRNFRPDTVLGSGGFGTVFKGWVDEKTLAPSKPGVGMAVAVKKSNSDSDQGIEEWQSEVEFLGKFSHPNLVKLLGYCCEENQFLLVYEYVQKRSLETHLFRKGGDLSWEIRMKIALGAAQGLAFLHTTEKQVIYRDFKAANILLDGDYNAKLSDFGLAKFGPLTGFSHLTTRVIGTYGYAAPEYVRTGHLYVRSDVYGFGVVLLELLSGLRVVDVNRPSAEHNLVDWAKPCLPDKRKLRKIMDPRLESQFPPKAAVKTAQLILKCLEIEPKKRPSMQEVVETLQEISALEMKLKESNTSIEDIPGRRLPHHSPHNNHFNHNRALLHGGAQSPLPKARY